MLLIDTRDPPPPPASPERAAWEPNWRLWAHVVLAVGAVLGAQATTGVVAYVLVCAALAFGCRALAVALPYGVGLSEYRQ